MYQYLLDKEDLKDLVDNLTANVENMLVFIANKMDDKLIGFLIVGILLVIMFFFNRKVRLFAWVKEQLLVLKNDKKTSLEIFGGYIHTYKFDEAVRDGVVLDLRYEFRDVPGIKAKYARLTCFGNNITTWNSVTEFAVLGKK